MRNRDLLTRLDGSLERIDRHMGRIDQHMARGNEHMARGNRLMERVEEEMRLTREFHAQALDDMRSFAREMAARIERIGREELRQLADVGNRLVQVDEGHRELREESKAQTRALLKVIDRMDRLDPGSAGA